MRCRKERLADWRAEVQELFGGGKVEGEGFGGGFGGDETAVEVGEGAGLHGFAPAVAAARDEGCVDGVRGFFEPFVFTLTATLEVRSCVLWIAETE